MAYANSVEYILRAAPVRPISVFVEKMQYNEHLGLTMVYFECEDGSKGAMDRRTFQQFYSAR